MTCYTASTSQVLLQKPSNTKASGNKNPTPKGVGFLIYKVFVIL